MIAASPGPAYLSATNNNKPSVVATMAANLTSSDPVYLTPGFFTSAIGSDGLNPFDQSFEASAGTGDDFLSSGPKSVSGVSTPGNGFGSNEPFKPLSPPSNTNDDFLDTGSQNNIFGPYFFPNVKPLTPPFHPMSPGEQRFGTDLQQSVKKLNTQVGSGNTEVRNGIVTPVSALSPGSRDGASHSQSEQVEESGGSNGLTVAKKAKLSSEKSSSPKKPRKRVRKPRGARFGDSTNRDDEKLAKFRERNRLAASKCREKKKAWTGNLETRVRELQAGKESLALLAASMKEELNYLQEQLIRHGDCGFEPITRYLQKAAERSFTPTPYSAKPQLHSRHASIISDASLYSSMTDDRDLLDQLDSAADAMSNSPLESKNSPFSLGEDDTFDSLISHQASQDDSGGIAVKHEETTVM